MPTINERLQSQQIRHQVFLLRFANGEVRRIMQALLEVERSLVEQLAGRLVNIQARGRDLGPRVTARLEAMLTQVREINARFFDDFETALTGRLREAAKVEAKFQHRLLQQAFASARAANLPHLSTIGALVNKFPIRGVPFKQWMTTGRDRAYFRLEQAVRVGIIEGQPLQQIISAVRQTVGGTRRGLRYAITTITNHVMTQAREEVFIANREALAGVQWVSTLDSRTTPICISRDGEVYPVGEGPRPPAHGNCRSTTVAAVLGAEEFLGERASQFGPVPERVTYGDWLKTLSVQQQNEILGKAKAVAWRAGRLQLSDLADPITGRTMSLAELGLLEPAG